MVADRCIHPSTWPIGVYGPTRKTSSNPMTSGGNSKPITGLSWVGDGTLGFTLTRTAESSEEVRTLDVTTASGNVLAASRVVWSQYVPAPPRGSNPYHAPQACSTPFLTGNGQAVVCTTSSYSASDKRLSAVFLAYPLAAPDRPVVAVTGDGCFTMVPHVLCTAVEYDIPVVWVIWNNFGWVSIRDIQLGMFGGREYGTMFHQGANKKPFNPDFAAWAKASGVDALTVDKSEDFRGALEHAIKANKPFLLDVHVDAKVRPPSTGAWELPPTPYKEPMFGQRFIPDVAPVK